MSDFLKSDKLYFVYPEYNPFWIYMGWWLYAIPVDNLNDSKNMEDWEQATWLNYDWRLDALFEALTMPTTNTLRKESGCPNYHVDPSQYCPAFMHKYPAGIVCKIEGDGRKFLPQSSENIGDYLRRVRERQLLHIAKAQEERENEGSPETPPPSEAVKP